MRVDAVGRGVVGPSRCVYMTKCNPRRQRREMVFDDDAEPACVAEPLFGRSNVVQI